MSESNDLIGALSRAERRAIANVAQQFAEEMTELARSLAAVYALPLTRMATESFAAIMRDPAVIRATQNVLLQMNVDRSNQASQDLASFAVYGMKPSHENESKGLDTPSFDQRDPVVIEVSSPVM